MFLNMATWNLQGFGLVHQRYRIMLRAKSQAVTVVTSSVPAYGSQRAQYPLTKEYTLNHNIKAPIIEGIFRS